MYLEFFTLIYDYFRTVKKNEIKFELYTPTLISIFVFITLCVNNQTGAASKMLDNVLNVLGVILAFCITIIAILTSSSNGNLEEIKQIKTEIKLENKYISLYKLVLINFSYLVTVCSFLILLCIIYPFILENFNINRIIKYAGFSIVILFVNHIFFSTIRNIVNFYLIITKE